jgi:predicted amidophosphoribosyltransferase
VIHPEKIFGKTILLVDDVVTTGATFAELRRVLNKTGAKTVMGVTFCRVVRAI